ncbi:MAG: hypothetical protein ACJAT2_001938 [Bacteriovoracaceae bacterium]
MYCKLILLLILLPSSLFSKEREFHLSDAWLKLLHYQKTFSGFKSKASRAEFFFSPSGQSDPKEELAQTLKAFRGEESIEGGHPACRFPARFKLLNKHFLDLKKPSSCLHLDKWLKGIDAGDLYLVFSSAYPSNPASLFGHTFLRFDRKSHNITSQSKKLLGYSMAFQAQIDQSDNSFLYTFKGITGGYQSYLEIKPHYMDVGIYNNSESRDLWEYPVPLNQDEKETFLLHVWEIITGTTFPYFFLDENCSTLVLELLEAAKPEWSFKSKNDLFVVPQVTLKDIVKTTGNYEARFRPAIKRIIWKRFESLNKDEVKNVLEAREDLDKIGKLNSINELDLLIDLWKLDNYKKTTTMSEESKSKMNATLLRRSQLNGTSKEYSLVKENALRAPHLGHEFKSFSLLWNKNLKANLSYGFHGFDDPVQGYDEKSYIDFLDIEIQYREKKVQISDFKLIEIVSLQNFTFSYPHLSWNIKIWSDQEEESEKITRRINSTGGVGLSKIAESWQMYLFINLKFSNYTKSGHNLLGPLLRLGLKKSLSKKIEILTIMEASKMPSIESFMGSASLSYLIKKDTRILIGGEYDSVAKKLEALSKLQFYF